MARFPLVIALALDGRPVVPEWALSMWAMNRPLNVNNTIDAVKGKERGLARSELCKKARQKHGADYILLVDDDTAPPQNGLLQLLYELQNAPPEFKVCAGIYCSKTNPVQPLVFQHPGEGAYWDWSVGDVFECTDFIATGFMLIRADVFDTLPEPWFRDVSSVEEADSLGMADDTGIPKEQIWDLQMTDDAFFCRKLRKHGYRLMAHGGVLPLHWGQDGHPYGLPENSKPVLSFYKKEARARRVSLDKALGIEGWMNFFELAWLAEKAQSHHEIVELGSYQGRSTRALADNTSGTVWAIDDWQGPRDTEWIGTPDLSNLHEKFLANLADLNGKVRVIQSDHATAEVPITPDMVFIDGSHEYADVKRDIENWRPRLKRGGLLCGHDIDWPGVEKAVPELVPGYRVVPNTSIWFKEL